MTHFSFPHRLNHAAVSHIENHIIELCRAYATYEDLCAASAPLWHWACQTLHKSPGELRHEIETHETDEHFPTPYLEEKDHLLKLPLLLLEKINHVP